MGGFILIDRLTNATVGAGCSTSPSAAPATSTGRPSRSTGPARRSSGQRPAVAWFTGLSGAGKSTIANLVERKLHADGRHTYLLDGDNVRHGINRDLGFTEPDRVENIRRAAEVAALMADAGLIVLVSLISPFRSEARSARQLVGDDEFIEVFVDTPSRWPRPATARASTPRPGRGAQPNRNRGGPPSPPTGRAP